MDQFTERVNPVQLAMLEFGQWSSSGIAATRAGAFCNRTKSYRSSKQAPNLLSTIVYAMLDLLVRNHGHRWRRMDNWFS